RVPICCAVWDPQRRRRRRTNGRSRWSAMIASVDFSNGGCGRFKVRDYFEGGPLVNHVETYPAGTTKLGASVGKTKAPFNLSPSMRAHKHLGGGSQPNRGLNEETMPFTSTR